MITERQLHLFKSRRQRGTKPPPAFEFNVQCKIADDLRRWATPNWIWTHFPAGERRDPITGARLKRMGLKPGWPDLVLIPPKGHPNGRPHFLELKRAGGTLTEAQAGFRLWCMLNECPFVCVDDYKAAVTILQQWGALRSGVHVQ
jgi:hypothetical protein